MIELRSLSKQFEKHFALDALDLKLEAGGVYALVGSNGSGKSTLLRTIAGVYAADSGSVLIDGEAAFDAPQVKRKVFFLPDTPTFFKNASVLTMADFYRRFYPNFDMAQLRSLERVFPIDLKMRIDRMSKGMQRQAALMLGVVLQCYQHGYLFSKKTADLYCTLPLRRDSLLILRFGASFVGAVFSMTVSFVGLAVANSLSGVQGIAFSELAKLYGLSLLLLLLCMSAVEIFVVNAGTVFNVIFSAAVVCVGLPLLCLIGYSWKASAAFGAIESYGWTQYTSPFVFAVYRLAAQIAEVEKGRVVVELSTVLISLGGSAVFLAIAFFMHHYRKTERAGSGFGYFAVPVIIAVLASAMGGYLVGVIFGANNEMSFWVYVCIGAALAAVASGAIIAKSFAKLGRWFVCAAVAAALLLGLYLVTNHIGEREKYYVPDVDDVASVYLSETEDSEFSVTLTENIELVTRLHEYAIAAEDGEFGSESNDYTYSELVGSHFNLTYTLKSGETVERTYWLHSAKALAMKLEIMQTEEYRQAWLDGKQEELDLSFPLFEFDADAEGVFAAMPAEEVQAFLTVYSQELQNAEPEALVKETREWENCRRISIETFHIYSDITYTDCRIYLTVPKSFTRTLRLADELIEKYALEPIEDLNTLPEN